MGGGRSHQGDISVQNLNLDKFTFDVIAPLLKVNELRQHGITLTLLLESEREQIPDVPAVYFVQPTARNVQKISQDLGKTLYEVITFTSRESCQEAVWRSWRRPR